MLTPDSLHWDQFDNSNTFIFQHVLWGGGSSEEGCSQGYDICITTYYKYLKVIVTHGDSFNCFNCLTQIVNQCKFLYHIIPDSS